jgi:hypothetical protein
VSLVTWDKPHFKHQEEPRSVSKAKRRAINAKALEDAYADVDRRDAGYCWVTGRYTQPKHVDARVRREHHHLKGRRVKPEWVTRPERIITVCAEAHHLITIGWIVVEGADARKPLFFHYAEFVTPKQKTFQIKPRRQQGQG